VVALTPGARLGGSSVSLVLRPVGWRSANSRSYLLPRERRSPILRPLFRSRSRVLQTQTYGLPASIAEVTTSCIHGSPLR
jgi:hypothetical protein